MSAITRKPELLAGSLVLIVLSAAATAADKRRHTQPQEVDKQSLSQLVSDTSLEDPNCRKIRRMLWIEKEGWVVRKSRICT